MPGRHPDQDVLADLAAEVLPEAQARAVEAHVIGCPRCADLLADAERVRRLLLADDPGPMPVDVWRRIETALDVEAGARAYRGTSMPGATDRSDRAARTDLPWQQPEPGWTPAPEPVAGSDGYAPTAPFDSASTAPLDSGDAPTAPLDSADPSTAQWRLFAHPDGERAQPALGGDAHRDEAAEATRIGRAERWSTIPSLKPSNRPGRPSIRSSASASRALRSRREVRGESRPGVLARYGKPLGIAAGVVAVAGLGGLVVTRLPLGVGTGASTGTTAGGASEFSAGAAAAPGDVVLASGTNYTAKTIVAKALALAPVAGAQRQAADSAAAGGAPAASASAAAAGSAAAAAPSAPAAAVHGPTPATTFAARTSALSSKSLSGNVDLTDPAKLRACLTELGAGDGRAIAVDLARYEGRDAAIIVIAARDGGYEVWAVSRDCHAGSGGQLAFKTVPPS